jgi:hypothetical protein
VWKSSAPHFQQKEITDNDPEYVTSQSFQEMLQTPKENAHNGVTQNAPNSQTIHLKNCFTNKWTKAGWKEGRKEKAF